MQTEVAQLYVQDRFGSVTRPVKELKRFERIALKSGESRSKLQSADRGARLLEHRYEEGC